VIGLSVVIYGVVLDDRADVSSPSLESLILWIWFWTLLSLHAISRLWIQAERIAGLVLTCLVLVSLSVLALKDPGVVATSAEPVGELSTFCEKCESYRYV
jgi:hypothetical protein